MSVCFFLLFFTSATAACTVYQDLSGQFGGCLKLVWESIRLATASLCLIDNNVIMGGGGRRDEEKRGQEGRDSAPPLQMIFLLGVQA